MECLMKTFWTNFSRVAAVALTAIIGRLDMALDEAKVKGWAVVSMKDDWKLVFKFQQ